MVSSCQLQNYWRIFFFCLSLIWSQETISEFWEENHWLWAFYIIQLCSVWQTNRPLLHILLWIFCNDVWAHGESMSSGQLTDGVSFSCNNLSQLTYGRLPFVEQLRILDLGVCVIDEVLLWDGDTVVKTVVLADGDDRVTHLQRPAVHDLRDVDVLSLPLHGLWQNISKYIIHSQITMLGV